jgi:hypothetical protein
MEIFIPLIVCVVLLFVAFGLGAWAICYQGARNERDITCYKCGHAFEMGINGIKGNNGPICDTCAGVERDDKGRAWLPVETVYVAHDLNTDGIEVTTREQAFANGGRE